jgi:serine/threonine protein phosphatase PrpC
MNDMERPFHAAKATATGSRHNNQDRCFFFDDGHSVLLGVADGLGGHPRGEVAAQLFADVCEAQFRQASRPLDDPEQFMLSCIGQAHQAIQRFGQRQQPAISPRTTAVLAVIQDGVAQWAHVGDSRLYLYRASMLRLQTQDHSQVHYTRHRTTEPARARSSLTRCLGGLMQPPLTTCSSPVRLGAGDGLLLCTDGFWGQTSGPQLDALFSATPETLEARLPQLVDATAKHYGSDNVTAVALVWTRPADDDIVPDDDAPTSRDQAPPVEPASTDED